MASIPAPIRATLGLLATALDTVQELVEHAPELPMEAVGNSMQLSLRLQQHYVALLTRGDEFLANLRGVPEEAPAWATFDESPVPDTASSAEAESPFETETEDESGLDEVEDLPPAQREGSSRHAGQGDPLLDVVEAAASAARTRAAKSAAPRKAAAKKAPTAKKAAPARVAPANLTPAKATRAAKAAPVTKAAPFRSAAPVKSAASAAKAAPAKKAAAPAKVAPATKAAVPAKILPAAKAAARKAASQDSAAPAKRATPGRARKVAAGTTAVETPPILPIVPTLDAELDNGLPSARQLSAFDLAVDGDGGGPVADLAEAASPASVAIDVTPIVADDPSSDAS